MGCEKNEKWSFRESACRHCDSDSANAQGDYAAGHEPGFVDDSEHLTMSATTNNIRLKVNASVAFCTSFNGRPSACSRIGPDSECPDASDSLQ